jgi:hypothetical protein
MHHRLVWPRLLMLLQPPKKGKAPRLLMLFHPLQRGVAPLPSSWNRRAKLSNRVLQLSPPRVISISTISANAARIGRRVEPVALDMAKSKRRQLRVELEMSLPTTSSTYLEEINWLTIFLAREEMAAAPMHIMTVPARIVAAVIRNRLLPTATTVTLMTTRKKVRVTTPM